MSLLFYLPPDDTMRHLGTSIYAPKNPDFRCEGTGHHSFELFKKVATMEYRPNTLFAFFKTERAFHGVDRIADAGSGARPPAVQHLRDQDRRAAPRAGAGEARLAWPWQKSPAVRRGRHRDRNTSD